MAAPIIPLERERRVLRRTWRIRLAHPHAVEAVVRTRFGDDRHRTRRRSVQDEQPPFPSDDPCGPDAA